MNGESELKTQTIEGKRKRIQELLERYPSKLGLGLLAPINDTNRYLTMSVNEQRKLTASECGEAAVVLNQAATYIQLEANRIQADIKWCKNYIEWLIADTITNVGGQYTPFEYRKILAIKQNDVTMELQTIVTEAQVRADCIAYMPNQLRGTASSFADLQQTKRSQRG